jgi:hypothetical protein
MSKKNVYIMSVLLQYDRGIGKKREQRAHLNYDIEVFLLIHDVQTNELLYLCF